MSKQKIEVGKRIAEVRKAKKIKQDELKELIGAPTVQMISGWENGHSFPSVTYLIKIAETLDTSLDYLLRGIKTVAKDTSIRSYKDVVVYLFELVNVGILRFNDLPPNFTNRRQVGDYTLTLKSTDEIVYSFKEDYEKLLNAKDILEPDLYFQAVKNVFNKYDKPLNNK